jgi:hypothetical protein
MRLPATFLLLCMFTGIVAQQRQRDSIFLMNGQVVAAHVIDTTLGAVTIHHPEKLTGRIHYERDQLYMVKFDNGYKRFFYVQDSTINNWFTRDEMWMYMKGEADARKGFRARGALIGSTIAGFIGGMTGTIWGPVAPYGYMALSGIPRVRIVHSTVSDPRYLQSDAYVLGYERVARQKMKLRSLLGGSIGLVAGYGFYAVFHNSYPENLNVGLGK